MPAAATGSYPAAATKRATGAGLGERPALATAADPEIQAMARWRGEALWDPLSI